MIVLSGALLLLAAVGQAGVAHAATVTFNSTGAEQRFSVPSGVTSIDVVAIGGRGGGSGGLGGFGAVASATLAVTPGQVLYVDVGGNGEAGGNPDAFPVDMTFGKGGFNGGSDGGGGGSPLLVLYGSGGGGGGGASDVRALPRTPPSLGARLVVAGGGGGAGSAGDGGGAGSAGTSGAPSVGCLAGGGGSPGTAVAGGSGGPGGRTFLGTFGAVGGDGALGDGGAGGRNRFGGGGGGGGGGLYGGGGGGSGDGDVTSRTRCTAGGGGGGSAFFASATTNTALAIDTSGVPRVTLTYSPPGGGVAPVAPTTAGGAADRRAPSLSKPKLTRKRFRVGPKPTAQTAARRRKAPQGTTVSYVLSEPATVSTAIDRKLKGRRVRRKGRKAKCLRETRRNRKGHKRCTLYKKAGTLTRQGALGKNSFAFSGRIGKKKLAAGSYQLTLTPTDRAGNTGKARTLRFQIVR